MKVICIDNTSKFTESDQQLCFSYLLTIGEKYKASLCPTMYDPQTYQAVDPSYVITCNDGKMRKFDARHFITIQEHRELQLHKVLK